jgi:hypothetical protein
MASCQEIFSILRTFGMSKEDGHPLEILEALSGAELLDLCISLQIRNAALEKELGELQNLNVAIQENALTLIDSDACPAHGEMIRALSFENFMSLHQSVGCRYCLSDKVTKSSEKLKLVQ